MHNEDGQPHLTYYIPEFALSFVWNGVWGDAIEVCPGGYGEPVRWLIITPTGAPPFNLALTDHLAWFKECCDEWVIRKIIEGGS